MSEKDTKKWISSDEYDDPCRKQRAEELGLGDASWAEITAFHIENLRIFYAKALSLPTDCTWREIVAVYRDFEEKWLESNRRSAVLDKPIESRKNT